MTRTCLNYAAQVNKKSASAQHARTVIETEDIRRLLSDALGREISDDELRDIAKGRQLHRLVTLMHAIRQCDRMIAARNLPNNAWIAINRAKLGYLKEMSQVTQELNAIAEGAHQWAMSNAGEVCLESSDPNVRIASPPNVTEAESLIEGR